MTENEAIMKFMNGHPSIAQSEWILQGINIDDFPDLKKRAIARIMKLYETTQSTAEALGNRFFELVQ